MSSLLFVLCDIVASCPSCFDLFLSSGYPCLLFKWTSLRPTPGVEIDYTPYPTFGALPVPPTPPPVFEVGPETMAPTVAGSGGAGAASSFPTFSSGSTLPTFAVSTVAGTAPPVAAQTAPPVAAGAAGGPTEWPTFSDVANGTPPPVFEVAVGTTAPTVAGSDGASTAGSTAGTSEASAGASSTSTLEGSSTSTLEGSSASNMTTLAEIIEESKGTRLFMMIHTKTDANDDEP